MHCFFHIKGFQSHFAALKIRELVNSWFRFFDVMNRLVISKSFSGSSLDHFLKQNTHRQASIIYYEEGGKVGLFKPRYF